MQSVIGGIIDSVTEGVIESLVGEVSDCGS